MKKNLILCEAAYEPVEGHDFAAVAVEVVNGKILHPYSGIG
jgi:hypothetical protein